MDEEASHHEINSNRSQENQHHESQLSKSSFETLNLSQLVRDSTEHYIPPGLSHPPRDDTFDDLKRNESKLAERTEEGRTSEHE
ncbi:Oidioi.mRNA.OKI2018_I69.XSR.g13870.t1.cds [Oikopleura dioica]|uniref:Oidioi.mRNA.OKI2018_I69.XSR.g13870.t1.cds n=1 Tax=Oikopleura dioica TaxID=34765 RepID=A0ABN7SF81_OIKDI|nr:Oidioi.mRNA.OKI2018_I69.XSR.g13870.t1.cds [Oikopleura dioica]